MKYLEIVEPVLDWLVRKICYFKQASILREYEQTINGGPAPADWHDREKIPTLRNWPEAKNGVVPILIGAQRAGKIRPVPAETFPIKGGLLPEETVEKTQ